MEWEAADQVAKNPQTGEQVGLVGGQWIPVDQAARNDQGKWVVTRKQASMPPPRAEVPGGDYLKAAVQPVLDVPRETMAVGKKAMEAVGQDIEQMVGAPSVWEKAKAAGGAVLDVANLPFAPVEGPVRAIAGRPIAKAAGKPELEEPITQTLTQAVQIFGPAAAIVKGREAPKVEVGKPPEPPKQEPTLGEEPKIVEPKREATVPEVVKEMDNAASGLGKEYTAGTLGDVRDAAIAEGYRAISQVTAKGRQLLGKDYKDSMKLVHAIQSGDLSQLTPTEREAAGLAIKVFEDLGKAGTESQVLPALKANYVPQIWDLTDKHTKSVYDALLKAGAIPSSSTTFTPFSLQSTLTSYEEGIRLGMKPKYTDLFKIVEEYSRSVIPAIEQSKMISALKNYIAPDGSRLVVPTSMGKPPGWITARHPDLMGYAYHPELKPSIDMLVNSYDPGIMMKSLSLLSGITKRLNVSMSYFHANSLFQAWLGTGGNPAMVKSAIDAAKKAYMTGGPGDTISLGLRNGLKIEAPLEDRIGRRQLQDVLHSVEDVAVVGKVAKGISKVDEHFNRFTWEYLHTGFKLETFSRVFEAEKGRELALAAKNPAYKMRSDEEIAKTVASYTNSIFGGLDWRRMAESVRNPLLKRYAAWAATKQGQTAMQATLFAPDWTVSTIQAWTRAIPGITAPDLQRLHSSYVGRSALITAIISDAVNVAASGHHVWQNHAPGYERGYKETWQDKLEAMTWIDLGGGLRMQAFKHFMEVPHMIAHPDKFAVGKIAAPGQIAGTQLLGVEYLSPFGNAPRMYGWQDRVNNLLKRALPFTAGGFMGGIVSDRPVWTMLSGALGAPVYGSTEEERLRRRLKEREHRIEERQ